MTKFFQIPQKLEFFSLKKNMNTSKTMHGTHENFFRWSTHTLEARVTIILHYLNWHNCIRKKSWPPWTWRALHGGGPGRNGRKGQDCLKTMSILKQKCSKLCLNQLQSKGSLPKFSAELWWAHCIFLKYANFCDFKIMVSSLVVYQRNVVLLCQESVQKQWATFTRKNFSATKIGFRRSCIAQCYILEMQILAGAA